MKFFILNKTSYIHFLRSHTAKHEMREKFSNNSYTLILLNQFKMNVVQCRAKYNKLDLQKNLKISHDTFVFRNEKTRQNF